jgi:hypothetical protein
VSKIEEGPNRSISLSSILSTHKPNSTFGPKTGSRSGGRFEGHLNIVQHLKIHNFANFQPNLSEGDFLYVKVDILSRKLNINKTDLYVPVRPTILGHFQKGLDINASTKVPYDRRAL